MLDIESKCITISDVNKFTKIIVDNSVKSKNFVDKYAISGFINNSDLKTELAKLAKKAELKAEQLKIPKLQAFDLNCFLDKSHFQEGSAQKYVVFQPMHRYFNKIIGVGSGDYIYFWESKR